MNKIQAEEKLIELRKSLAEATDDKEKETLTLEIAKVVAISMSLGEPLNRMVVTNE